jgi:L-lactate dehydrogenase
LQAAWSTATICGCSVHTLLPPSAPTLPAFANSAKTKAYSIIAAKGATSYGIASVVSSVCESILFNQRHTRPVSHWVDNLGCCISLPAVLGHGGVQKTIETPLNDEERQALRRSAEEIRKCVEEIEGKEI